MDRVRTLWRHLTGRRRDLTPHHRAGVVEIAHGPGRGLRIDLTRASADYQSGTNELPVQRAIVESLEHGQVFYDVGSNVGFFALLAASKVGASGTVVAFEPVPANVERIRANAELNGFTHLRVLQVAASDVDGEAELLLSKHPGGATLSTTDTPPDFTGKLSVHAVRLDRLVAAGELPAPDVVKIDVEGAEFAVLAGMREILTAHRPTLVIELDSADHDTLARKRGRFHDLMALSGYDVHELEDSYRGSGWNVVHVVAAPAGVMGPGQGLAT